MPRVALVQLHWWPGLRRRSSRVFVSVGHEKTIRNPCGLAGVIAELDGLGRSGFVDGSLSGLQTSSVGGTTCAWCIPRRVRP